ESSTATLPIRLRWSRKWPTRIRSFGCRTSRAGAVSALAPLAGSMVSPRRAAILSALTRAPVTQRATRVQRHRTTANPHVNRFGFAGGGGVAAGSDLHASLIWLARDQ